MPMNKKGNQALKDLLHKDNEAGGHEEGGHEEGGSV
jgi:hypothetical protein